VVRTMDAFLRTFSYIRSAAVKIDRLVRTLTRMVSGSEKIDTYSRVNAYKVDAELCNATLRYSAAYVSEYFARYYMYYSSNRTAMPACADRGHMLMQTSVA
jgi:hypothetical protein